MSASMKNLWEKVVVPENISSILLPKPVPIREPSSAPSIESWNQSVRQEITASASFHILIRVPSSSVSTSRDKSYRNAILSSASSNKYNRFQSASMVLKTIATANLVSITRLMTKSAWLPTSLIAVSKKMCAASQLSRDFPFWSRTRETAGRTLLALATETWNCFVRQERTLSQSVDGVKIQNTLIAQ